MGMGLEVPRAASENDILLPREIGNGLDRTFGFSENVTKKDDRLAGMAMRFRWIAGEALNQLVLSATVRASAAPASCRP